MCRALPAADQPPVRGFPRGAQLDLITVTVGIEKYHAREQCEHRLGAGPVQQTESEWTQLIAMLELAQRWQALIGEFTGEDAHAGGTTADDLGRHHGTTTTARRAG